VGEGKECLKMSEIQKKFRLSLNYYKNIDDISITNEDTVLLQNKIAKKIYKKVNFGIKY